LQALYLLNSDFSMRQARALAQRVLTTAGADRERQIDASFRLALQRLPDDAERQLARRFFDESAPQDSAAELPPTLVQWCQALMNVNEFVVVE